MKAKQFSVGLSQFVTALESIPREGKTIRQLNDIEAATELVLRAQRLSIPKDASVDDLEAARTLLLSLRETIRELIRDQKCFQEFSFLAEV